uniref:AMP-binding domain-containing protein n=1 Tax=Steinernema glaseri TaxID=37863 RepID=A0A1I8ADI4_9BILA
MSGSRCPDRRTQPSKFLVCTMPIVSEVAPIGRPSNPLHVDIFRRMLIYGEEKERPALIDPAGEETVSFAQLTESTIMMAHILETQGVQKGNVVSVFMPTSWRFPVAFLGIMTAGGVVTGAGVEGTHYETRRHLRECGAKFVVTDSEYVFEIIDSLKEIPTSEKPMLLVFIMKGDEFLEIPTDMRVCRIMTDSLYGHHLTFEKVCVPIDLDNDLATLFFSSGTTGLPKGVMSTHANLAYMSVMEMAFSERCVYPVLHKDGFDGKNEIMMMYMPLHMAMSFFTSVQSLRKGVAQVMIRCPVDVFEYIPKYKPTTFVTAPSMLAGLTARYTDCAAITNLTVGAAPTTRRQYNEVMKAYPNLKYFSQGYGMTELTVACCYTDFRYPIPFGSVGKIMPNMVMKIMKENGDECGVGEAGEIWVKGPNVMKGYLNNEQATRDTIDEEGFLHTGDIGYINSSEHIFITARMKELIKVGGRQVAPAELESELSTHPAIDEVAVIGVPDPERDSELPKAFVVLKEGETATVEDIQGYLNGKLSHYKQLAGGVQFINHIPRHRTGKILREQLRSKYCTPMRAHI